MTFNHVEGSEETSSGHLADVIFINGKVWTQNPKQPEASALAIWRSRIIAVGNSADVVGLALPNVQIVDLKNARVVPGFTDSHIHLLGSGMRLSQVSLKDARDEREFGTRLQEYDRRLPRDRWLFGGDWDHDRTFDGKLPTCELLDRYVADRPVFLRRYDGHMALVNSRVLKMAGISATTPDPPGGVIFRDPRSKEATGILRDNAMDLIKPLMPPTSEAEIAEAVRASLREIARNGLTSVEDMDGSDAPTRAKLLRHYQRLARTGELTARIDFRWPLPEWEQLSELGLLAGFGNDWLQIGGLKGFMDGSLGSCTAKMFEPYLNEPSSTGVFVTPLEKMRSYILAADRAGLSVAVHAIGDRANAELLEIFAEAVRENGRRDRRFRIEHAQHLRAQDYVKFHQSNIIASMQPYHVVDDGRWAEARIGAGRCTSSYAYRSLLDAQVRIAFGSDWSVAPLSPLQGIDAAVNRRTLDGKHPEGWFPEQRISVREAIEAYTISAAYAAFHEKDRGTLEPGKLADFTVLSKDILDPTQRDQIANTEVLLTVVGGRTVYQK
jgi:predicted amidohydrolase YtcJ